MSEAKLTADEVEILRVVLRALVVRRRTGEVGVVHGLDRFVGTEIRLRKPERGALDAAVRKLGLPGLRVRDD